MKKVYVNAYTEDGDITIGIRSEVWWEDALQDETGYYNYYTDTCPLPFDLVYHNGEIFHKEESLGRLPVSTSFDTPDVHVIVDWTGKRLFPDKEFDSFEEGWDFVYENIHEEYEGDGAYEDIYVEPKTNKNAWI